MVRGHAKATGGTLAANFFGVELSVVEPSFEQLGVLGKDDFGLVGSQIFERELGEVNCFSVGGLERAILGQPGERLGHLRRLAGAL